jgi:hypothetical protein
MKFHLITLKYVIKLWMDFAAVKGRFVSYSIGPVVGRISIDEFVHMSA